MTGNRVGAATAVKMGMRRVQESSLARRETVRFGERSRAEGVSRFSVVDPAQRHLRERSRFRRAARLSLRTRVRCEESVYCTCMLQRDLMVHQIC